MPAGLKSKHTSNYELFDVLSLVIAAVILLSFVLAVGFLLIILSCALWQNWLPLLVGASPRPALQNAYKFTGNVF